MKLQYVPLLSASGLSAHHFGPWTSWKPEELPLHDIFYINRLENYIDHVRFPCPASQDRARLRWSS